MLQTWDNLEECMPKFKNDYLYLGGETTNIFENTFSFFCE